MGKLYNKKIEIGKIYPTAIADQKASLDLKWMYSFIGILSNFIWCLIIEVRMEFAFFYP